MLIRMKPGDSFKCYLVSWEEAYGLSKTLAKKIKASGFKPEIVVAIARGGLVPARTVCDFLLQKDLATVKVEHWGIAATPDERAVIKFPLPVAIEGKKVLVIDDVADTGDTFVETLKYLKSLGPSEVRTAVLQYKTSSVYEPDYWAEKISNWKWIIYPWALYEDLTGFIEKALRNGPLSIEGIIVELDRRFGLKVERDGVLEILEDMRTNGKARFYEDGTWGLV
jgi:hypoxanthine phosphoribosyltransferase